ncbi:hypothetical protein [Avibacterium paragallinarum]|uniref:Uncharacterized protein n=1 Tax=Avibacterium paragallinarum TaxID=728 RepID=A0A8B3TBP8_AVIPA|nr:hypothetical protein [Avibacterium paragallinarum]RZN58807.1 hypothetical protein EIG79_07055 [Avibacterium paragallinarum]
MTQERLNQLEAENARLKAQLRAEETAKNEAFLNELVSQGKLAPRVKEQALKLLNYAESYDNGETLDFSEGESLSHIVKDYLSQQPQIIVFSEIATKENAPEDLERKAINYAENTPPEMIALDMQIREYAARNKLSYSDAFNIITNQGAN